MPTGMSGLFRNTYGARVRQGEIKPDAQRGHDMKPDAQRGHDMKRLERAIGIFRKTRRIYKGDTTVCMMMNTDDVAEILGWLEELKEYRAMGLDEFRGQGREKYIDGIGYVIET